MYTYKMYDVSTSYTMYMDLDLYFTTPKTGQYIHHQRRYIQKYPVKMILACKL